MQDKITNLIVLMLIVLSAYNTYMLNSLSYKLDDKVIAITNSVNSAQINTDGKLQNLKKDYDKLASTVSTQVVQKQITYIQKESIDDADVELKSNPPKIKVRVNNGQTYSFDALADEKYKFENGKLVINSAATTNIDITTDKPTQSRWSFTTALNSDKKVLGSVNYDLTRSLAATIMVGQDIKPYYGFTYRIGSHK